MASFFSVYAVLFATLEASSFHALWWVTECTLRYDVRQQIPGMYMSCSYVPSGKRVIATCSCSYRALISQVPSRLVPAEGTTNCTTACMYERTRKQWRNFFLGWMGYCWYWCLPTALRLINRTDFCLCCVYAFLFFAVVPTQPNVDLDPSHTFVCCWWCCFWNRVVLLSQPTHQNPVPRRLTLFYVDYDFCLLSTPECVRWRQVDIAMAPELKTPVPPGKYEFACSRYIPHLFIEGARWIKPEKGRQLIFLLCRVPRRSVVYNTW